MRLELSGALGAASSASQQTPFGAVPVRHHEVLSAPHVLLLKTGARLPTPQDSPLQLLGVCGPVRKVESCLWLQFRSWRADLGFEGTLLAQ